MAMVTTWSLYRQQDEEFVLAGVDLFARTGWAHTEGLWMYAGQIYGWAMSARHIVAEPAGFSSRRAVLAVRRLERRGVLEAREGDQHHPRAWKRVTTTPSDEGSAT